MDDERTIETGTGGEQSANIAAAADHSRTTAHPGYVYFVRAGRVNRVKIGWAKTNVEKRIAELQCGCPHELILLGYVPGSLLDEWTWHDRFKSARVRGEWFTLTAELRLAFNKLIRVKGAVLYTNLSLLTRNAV